MSSSKRILALVFLVVLYAAVPILLFVSGVGVLLGVLYFGRFVANTETADLLKSLAAILTGTALAYVAWRIATWLRS